MRQSHILFDLAKTWQLIFSYLDLPENKNRTILSPQNVNLGKNWLELVKKQKSTNIQMSCFGLIEEDMDLSPVHQAVSNLIVINNGLIIDVASE